MADHPNLFAALAAAQAEAKTLIKDAENPHFRSKFAGLDTVAEEARRILPKHGLCFFSKPSYDDAGNPTLKYTLGHSSGEREDGEMLLLLSKNDPQGQGSATTYARRYSQCALLNLVADEDDDGEAAARHDAPARATKPRAKVKPAADATIPDAEVHALAAIYAVTGWKDPSAEDPHAFLRLQLATVGAGNEGDVKDCIRALTVPQGAKVRAALEAARDKQAAKDAA